MAHADPAWLQVHAISVLCGARCHYGIPHYSFYEPWYDHRMGNPVALGQVEWLGSWPGFVVDERVSRVDRKLAALLRPARSLAVTDQRCSL